MIKKYGHGKFQWLLATNEFEFDVSINMKHQIAKLIALSLTNAIKLIDVSYRHGISEITIGDVIKILQVMIM
ncbi:hypothetical protein HYD75_02475 [Mycoplasmopsis bovis]|nr:hypothetical protein [Mycoplasmopsis bovis]QQH48944.1 hypothetical protein HYD75_02475 [Mycoplasmopsis bovis]